ncbi:hypothetical protein ACEWY4_006986 [Coilia grayii]|uniref:Uncharacterized protein n=1 Tax=Coilia grayii TaxID=363190 RepID=A0ABD1KF89_9TELE
MKTIRYIFLGLLVIFFDSAKFSGQTTAPAHAESPTVQLDVGAFPLISTSTSRPSATSGEAAVSGPLPREETSLHSVTLTSPTEATHITASIPESSTVSEGRRDTTAGQTKVLFSTLAVLPEQNDSSLSPKPFSFTVPPGKGTTPMEPVTTPTLSANQTDSDHLNTYTPTSILLTTQTIPQSTLIPLFTQTTHQSTHQSATAKTAIETTSLPPAPTPTQFLRSKPHQTPAHLTVAPPTQEEPPQLDVGDEDSAHDGHHPPSPLDPILAGLVSVFIVCTAIASVLLFLKFRHRHEHPEFHRLQDLPMDDLLEDTPLSRYTY